MAGIIIDSITLGSIMDLGDVSRAMGAAPIDSTGVVGTPLTARIGVTADRVTLGAVRTISIYARTGEGETIGDEVERTPLSTARTTTIIDFTIVGSRIGAIAAGVASTTGVLRAKNVASPLAPMTIGAADIDAVMPSTKVLRSSAGPSLRLTQAPKRRAALTASTERPRRWRAACIGFRAT
jgi:hypothetical protein